VNKEFTTYTSISGKTIASLTTKFSNLNIRKDYKTFFNKLAERRLQQFGHHNPEASLPSAVLLKNEYAVVLECFHLLEASFFSTTPKPYVLILPHTSQVQL
jgi:hypothetical protein